MFIRGWLARYPLSLGAVCALSPAFPLAYSHSNTQTHSFIFRSHFSLFLRAARSIFADRGPIVERALVQGLWLQRFASLVSRVRRWWRLRTHKCTNTHTHTHVHTATQLGCADEPEQHHRPWAKAGAGSFGHYRRFLRCFLSFGLAARSNNHPRVTLADTPPLRGTLSIVRG